MWERERETRTMDPDEKDARFLTPPLGATATAGICSAGYNEKITAFAGNYVYMKARAHARIARGAPVQRRVQPRL